MKSTDFMRKSPLSGGLFFARSFFNKTWAVIFVLLLSSCAIAKKTEPITPPTPTADAFVEKIDLAGLQKSLGMIRDVEELGFQEKSFDTCRAGYGYSSTHRCRKQYFVVLNFRLQCRSTEGTVEEVTIAELMPVTHDRVRWTLAGAEGHTSTDGEGFGQLIAVLGRPGRQQRLRLTVGNDFLLMRAGQVNRVIVPRNWCGG